jgi:integrase
LTLDAVAAAGLRGRDGKLLHVTPHQLRHTFGTSLKMRGVASDASFPALCDRVSVQGFETGGLM